MRQHAAWRARHKSPGLDKINLRGHFSGPRHFASYDGKRPEKIESETRFSKQNTKKRTEMRQNNNKGEIWCPKIVAQPAVTSEKGVVFNPVRSNSGSGDESSQDFLKNFLFLKNHQNSPTFIKLTCSARASRDWKQVPSLTSEPTFPSVFRTFPKIVFVIFTHLCTFFWKSSLRFDFLRSFSIIRRKVPRTAEVPL